MQKTDTRKRAYRIVDTVFRHQKEIEEAIDEARAGNHGGHTGDGAGGHAFISDPTASEAINAAEELHAVRLDNGFVVRHPEAWVRVIHHSYESCREVERNVVQTYYRICEQYGSRRSAVTSMMCNVDEGTVYYMLKEFRNYAVEVACQLGLTRVINIRGGE